MVILPKPVDLHCHFEGAIPTWALRELLLSRGVNLEGYSLEMREKTFPAFICAWRRRFNVIQSEADLAFCAFAVGRELLLSQVDFVELHVSVSAYTRRFGWRLEVVLSRIVEGLRRSGFLRYRFVIDLVRHHGPESAAAVLCDIDASRLRHLIVGIGMGGIEESFPGAAYKGVFVRARDMGLGTTVHTGETTGADAVEDILDTLAPQRLGHAIAARTSAETLRKIADLNVVVELCPSSIIQTGQIENYQEICVHAFFSAGVNFALCTDDPAIFETGLDREYGLLLALGLISLSDAARISQVSRQFAFDPTSLGNDLDRSSSDY